MPEVGQLTSGTDCARLVEKCPVPMKLDYKLFDLSRVRTYPLAGRPSKVHHESFAKRWAPESGFAGWIASLPRIRSGLGGAHSTAFSPRIER